MDKKILAVTLTTGKPAALPAAWVGDELVMGEKTTYPEKRTMFRPNLIKDIHAREAKGFIVLVDEENSFVSGQAGQRIRLRDPHHNGQPVLVAAMGIYKELNSQGAIKFPRKESGKYQLPQSIFDVDRTKDGEEFYRIDWGALTSEHVLTLLCCYGTEYNNPASAGYISAMYGEVSGPKESSLAKTFMGIISGSQEHINSQVPQGPLTGQKSKSGRYL